MTGFRATSGDETVACKDLWSIYTVSRQGGSSRYEAKQLTTVGMANLWRALKQPDPAAKAKATTSPEPTLSSMSSTTPHDGGPLAAARDADFLKGVSGRSVIKAKPKAKTRELPREHPSKEVTRALVEELKTLYDELQSFKDDQKFLDVEFMQSKPYYSWLQTIEKFAHENRAARGSALYDELGFLPSDVTMLGST